MGRDMLLDSSSLKYRKSETTTEEYLDRMYRETKLEIFIIPYIEGYNAAWTGVYNECFEHSMEWTDGAFEF
ncbi:hypothetical protein CEXT_550111 [Caerostris extrusa]|uniref:Uncharacterized protein n=1 Tax=Caerostris extrusa TaxID=172846 RepID=A0AAV4TD05_CAEEX|nr:hypothetical protein CEXT_550111 [Caerostris extrusa]